MIRQSHQAELHGQYLFLAGRNGEIFPEFLSGKSVVLEQVISQPAPPPRRYGLTFKDFQNIHEAIELLEAIDNGSAVLNEALYQLRSLMADQ